MVRPAAVLAWSIAALLAAPAGRAATLDLRVAAASEEVFRGVVQNNSLTGSLRADLRSAGGVYVGSRLLHNRSAGDVQADFWAGLSRTVLAADLIPVSLDGGLVASVYGGDRGGPEHRDLDWAEARLSAGSGPLRAGLAFAPDYYGTGAAAWRLSAQLRWPLPARGTLLASAGWNEGAGVGRHLARRGGAARYADYLLEFGRDGPAGWSGFVQLAGASIRLDGSTRPRALLGLRWRWGRQLPGSTGR